MKHNFASTGLHSERLSSTIRSVLVAGMIALAATGTAFAKNVANFTLDSGEKVGGKPATVSHDAHVLIQLSGPAAVEVYANTLRASSAAQAASSADIFEIMPDGTRVPLASAATKPDNPATASPNAIAAAVSAARGQIMANISEQVSFKSAMQAAGIKHTEIYRVQRAMNGIAAIVPSAQLAALRKLPGVLAVRIIEPSHPTSSTSVPFINAPQVWQGLTGTAADGTNVKIGIIDTGIDYLHADFGGLGQASDYAVLDRTSNSQGYFPTAKVVGGTDLVGDAYNASGTGAALIPVPDPNPMDCNEHGSHVAGTAAGFGVKTDGTTYTGPYDTSVPNTLRILPGVAPKASLYAIRVFGCAGSTDVVVQAIDWALDPNQDMDLSDHLDIISMSLGVDVGGLSSLDAEASENAALAGMIVVAASGNANDSYMITSAPAVANRAISVAASWDGGEPAGNLAMTAPPALAGNNFFAVPAAFGPPVPGGGLSGTLVYYNTAAPHTACAAPDNAAALVGNIAVIDRGTCSFQPKVLAAQAAGAIGVVVVDSSAEVPITMGSDGVSANPTIPSVMISLADGALIKAQFAVSATVTANLATVSGGDLVASFSSRGPNNGMPVGLKPDITAPGVNIVSAQSGITAGGIIPNNQSLTISGTSMATPHVAGEMALLKQLHPTWSVEELKALAMNGATHDLTTKTGGAGLRYGAGRVGAGRIDAARSATNGLIAYNNDGSGRVALTFPSEISGTTNAIRTFHIENKGAANSPTFTVSIDTVVDNPGISFQVQGILGGGGSFIFGAGAALDVNVQMTGTANSVKHTREGTTFSVQGGNPREFLTEETAYVTLTSGGNTLLRIPLYVAPYPAAAMTAGGSLPTGGAASGGAVLTLSGTPVCTATYAAGPPATCNGMSFPADEVSLVSPFELHANNPRNGAVPAQVDVRYAGVNADLTDGLLNFGFQTWGPFGQPTYKDVDVEFTIFDALGNPTYTLFPAYVTVGNVASNVYVTSVFNWSTGTSSAYNLTQLAGGNFFDTRLFQNDVMFLSAPFNKLGLTAGSTFTYTIDTFDSSGFQEEVGPFTYHVGAQGFNTADAWLSSDLPGNTIGVAFNTVNLAANGALGGLLLHHHNKAGTTAEVILVPPATVTVAATSGTPQSTLVGTAFAAPLVVTLTDTFSNPVVGALVTFTLPATGASGTFAGGSKTADVVTDGSGVATSPVITANLVSGTYHATATAASVPGATPFTLTNLAGPATTLALVSGGGQSARVGTAFAAPIVVKVTDTNGNPVAGANVSWTAPTQGASATFILPPSLVTDAQGLTSVNVVANAISGAYNVTAQSGMLSSVDVGLTNTITIAAAGACSAITATDTDLVEQYYASILGRPSDATGKAFWISEAARLCGLGVDPKQTFLVLGNVFFNSPEYIARGRDNNGFVTDLYVAFLGRSPDAGGLAYWTGQMASGMPPNNVMNSFLFSPEFSATMNALFPGRTARAETYLVMNLYGGFFRRFPDTAGYTYWDGQFRAAQCAPNPAAVVQATINAVSSSFVGSPEYVLRATTNSQYVQDLYYAMLQRGGDLGGYNFWVAQLATSAQTRDQVRLQFLVSPEMAAQSAAIAAQGCLP